MTDARLLPCTSCARHVRVSEERCPFCAAAVPDTLRSHALPRQPGPRLSRAALFAFGTTAASLAACGGVTTNEPGDGGKNGSMVDAAYGGPPGDGGPTDDAPFLNAAYGGPPQDASSSADADATPEAGIAPPYGAPP